MRPAVPRLPLNQLRPREPDCWLLCFRWQCSSGVQLRTLRQLASSCWPSCQSADLSTWLSWQRDDRPRTTHQAEVLPWLGVAPAILNVALLLAATMLLGLQFALG